MWSKLAGQRRRTLACCQSCPLLVPAPALVPAERGEGRPTEAARPAALWALWRSPCRCRSRRMTGALACEPDWLSK